MSLNPKQEHFLKWKQHVKLQKQKLGKKIKLATSL